MMSLILHREAQISFNIYLQHHLLISCPKYELDPKITQTVKSNPLHEVRASTARNLSISMKKKKNLAKHYEVHG